MKKHLLLFIFIFSLVLSGVIAQKPVAIYDRTDKLNTGIIFTADDYGTNAGSMDTVLRASAPGTAQLSANRRPGGPGSGVDSKSMEISAAYPNPASVSTSFEYTIPEGSNGKLMLRNLTGRIVRQVVLDKQDGRIDLNLNDLNDGLYFYSVVLNNKVEVTRKLVIKH